jgi:hypothetical protein
LYYYAFEPPDEIAERHGFARGAARRPPLTTPWVTQTAVSIPEAAVAAEAAWFDASPCLSIFD